MGRSSSNAGLGSKHREERKELSKMTMTASVIRSRRTEGLRLASRLLGNSEDHRAPRPKRQLDPSARDSDTIVTKKARFTTGIAVEIPARPSSHTRFAKDTADARPVPAAQKPSAGAGTTAPKAPTSHRDSLANGPKPTRASSREQPTLTKHQEKVANGLKHELDRLRPTETDANGPRKLRSQESSRFKSELSAYFPEYDQIMGNEPKETHLLNLDTPIVVDLSDPAPLDGSLPQQLHTHTTTTTISPTYYPIRSYSDALFTDLHDAQRIDFSFLTNNNHNNNNRPPTTRTSRTAAADVDPLPDTLYWPLHKREARSERSIRNTEKGRAQHERDQIARLLDALQGHDWLRVMGVSGVTESKRQAFQPARGYFIKGCEGILDKFRRWAAEEKRRRLEVKEISKKIGGRKKGRERGPGPQDEEEGEGSVAGEGTERVAVVEAEEEEGSGEELEVEEEEEARDEEEEQQEEDEAEAEEKQGKRRGVVQGEPPDEVSDVDASIAKQLREEVLAAAASRTTYRNGRRAPSRMKPRRVRDIFGQLVPEELLPPEEYLSHFAPPYQNVITLGEDCTGRARRRKKLAWGQPVPVLKQRDFTLPAEVFEREELEAAIGKGRRRVVRK